MVRENIPLEKVMKTLEGGIESGEKRKQDVYEFVKGFSDVVLKVIVADAGEHWNVVTIIKFSR